MVATSVMELSSGLEAPSCMHPAIGLLCRAEFQIRKGILHACMATRNPSHISTIGGNRLLLMQAFAVAGTA